MRVILDIDGTLISEESSNIIFRPYLKEFLTFLFDYAESVSIWTNASQSWADTVLSELKSEFGMEYHFDFVWTSDKSTMIGYDITGPIYVKNLSKVWRSHREYCKNNTLIIDNLSINSQKNYGNAIIIPTFYSDLEDDYLKQLIDFLGKITSDCNIRNVPKNIFSIHNTTFF